MNRILDHDHSELDTMLESVIAALAKGVLDEAFERLDVFWGRLAVHIRAGNIHLFPALILAVKRTPLGSAISHPEASRIARLASGRRHGFAQPLFQVGGNAGSSVGLLLAAWIIVPHRQRRILWFTFLASFGILILSKAGQWYRRQLLEIHGTPHSVAHARPDIPFGKIVFFLGMLLVLMFSKLIYLASMTNYYTFYLIQKFGVSVQQSQVYLFLFLIAVALGIIVGGPVGDRIGCKFVIWISILGMSPFALLFGFAFGLAGIGSAVLGKLADMTSILFVINVCSILPLLGLLTGFFPGLRQVEEPGQPSDQRGGLGAC